MRSDRPLIVSILLLAAGLTLIIAYCNGTAAFNAAFPVSGSTLQFALTTTGAAAVGGAALTAFGLLALLWALVAAIISQFQTTRYDDRLTRLERRERAERANNPMRITE
jgi:hypothetical protein